MKKEYLWPIAVGLLSGCIDALLTASNGDFASHVTLSFAGIPFGLITGLYFVYVLPVNSKLARLLGWTVISGVSYYIAVQVSIAAFTSEMQAPVAYAIGGVVGSLLLAYGFNSIFHHIKQTQQSVVVAVGGVVAFLVAISFSQDAQHGTGSFLAVLYIAWQVAVTAALAASFLRPPNVHTTQN